MTSVPDEPRALPLADHAEELLAAQLALALNHAGLLRAALAGAADFRVARHYPARDVVDLRHGTRFFFHAHADGFDKRREYGHFHVFQDPVGTGRHSVTHLIGIAVDGQGLPVRLFTVNRWVTGERWLPAQALVGVASGFCCETSGRLAPVARWVTACMRAFAPLVDDLLLKRDQRLARCCDGGVPRQKVFEDRSLEVLTEHSVALVPSSPDENPPEEEIQ